MLTRSRWGRRWPLSGDRIVHGECEDSPAERLIGVRAEDTHRSAPVGSSACKGLIRIPEATSPIWQPSSRGHPRRFTPQQWPQNALNGLDSSKLRNPLPGRLSPADTSFVGAEPSWHGQLTTGQTPTPDSESSALIPTHQISDCALAPTTAQRGWLNLELKYTAAFFSILGSTATWVSQVA